MSFGKSSIRSLTEVLRSANSGRLMVLTWTHVTAAEAAAATSMANKAALLKRLASFQQPSILARIQPGEGDEGACGSLRNTCLD